MRLVLSLSFCLSSLASVEAQDWKVMLDTALADPEVIGHQAWSVSSLDYLLGEIEKGGTRGGFAGHIAAQVIGTHQPELADGRMQKLMSRVVDVSTARSWDVLYGRLPVVEVARDPWLMCSWADDVLQKALEVQTLKSDPELYNLLHQMAGPSAYFSMCWRLVRAKDHSPIAVEILETPLCSDWRREVVRLLSPSPSPRDPAPWDGVPDNIHEIAMYYALLLVRDSGMAADGGIDLRMLVRAVGSRHSICALTAADILRDGPPRFRYALLDILVKDEPHTAILAGQVLLSASPDEERKKSVLDAATRSSSPAVRKALEAFVQRPTR